jgi:hypothetical protein
LPNPITPMAIVVPPLVVEMPWQRPERSPDESV